MLIQVVLKAVKSFLTLKTKTGLQCVNNKADGNILPFQQPEPPSALPAARRKQQVMPGAGSAPIHGGSLQCESIRVYPDRVSGQGSQAPQDQQLSIKSLSLPKQAVYILEISTTLPSEVLLFLKCTAAQQHNQQQLCKGSSGHKFIHAEGLG